MKAIKFILLLFALCLKVCAQSTYYHDTTLDVIGNNQAFMDADLNTQSSIIGNFMNTNHYDLTNLLRGVGFGFATVISNQQANSISSLMATDNIVANNTLSNTNQIMEGVSVMQGVVSNLLGSYTPDAGFLTNGVNAPADGCDVNPEDSWIHFGDDNVGHFVLQLDVDSNLGESTVPITIRLFVLAFCGFLIYLFSVQAIKKNLDRAMNQRQAKGSSQEFLGVNASIVFAALLVALVAAAMGVIAEDIIGSGMLASGMAHLAAAKSALLNVQNYPAWGVLTSFVPVSGLLVEWLIYLAFRWVFLEPLFKLVQCLVFAFLS